MTKLSDLHTQWINDKSYQDAFDASAEEFEIARTLIAARTQAGLSQQEVAARMGTTQSTISRMEGGNSLPSMRAMLRFAKATGCHLVMQLEPTSTH